MAQLHRFIYADGIARGSAPYAGGRFFDSYLDFAADARCGADGDIGRTDAAAVYFAFRGHGDIGSGAAGITYAVLRACGLKCPQVRDRAAFIQADVDGRGFCGDAGGQDQRRRHFRAGGIAEGEVGQEAALIRRSGDFGIDACDDIADQRGNAFLAACVVQAQCGGFGFGGFSQQGGELIRAAEGDEVLFVDEIVVFGAGGCGIIGGIPFVVAQHRRVGQAEMHAGGAGRVIRICVDVGPFAVDFRDIPEGFAFDGAAFDAGCLQQHFQRQRIAFIVRAAGNDGVKSGGFGARLGGADQFFIKEPCLFIFILQIFCGGCPCGSLRGQRFFRIRGGFRFGGNGGAHLGGCGSACIRRGRGARFGGCGSACLGRHRGTHFRGCGSTCIRRCGRAGIRRGRGACIRRRRSGGRFCGYLGGRIRRRFCGRFGRRFSRRLGRRFSRRGGGRYFHHRRLGAFLHKRGRAAHDYSQTYKSGQAASDKVLHFRSSVSKDINRHTNPI